MSTFQCVPSCRTRFRSRAAKRNVPRVIEALEPRSLLSVAAVHTPVLETSPASGDEDTAIPLQIGVRLNAGDGATLNSVTISNIPAGARLSAGVDQGNGSWLLQPADLSGLTITPPPDSHADFDLHVSAAVTRSPRTPEVVLTSVAPDDPDRRVVYRLTSPSVTSFHSGAGASGGTVESFDVAFGTISVDYRPVDAAGNPLPARRSTWDTATNRATGAGNFTPESAASGTHTLSFGTTQTLKVLAYDWLLTGGTSGAANPGRFVFSTPLGGASPSLLVAGAAGTRIPTMTLRSEIPLPDGGRRTTIWTLSSVAVASHSATLADPAGMPVDTFALDFGVVEVATVAVDGLGAAVPAATASWDFGRSSGARANRAGDLLSLAGPHTVEFVHGQDRPAFAVSSYAWGINATGSGAGRSREFVLTAPPTGSDPWLVHSVASGAHIERAVVRSRDAAGNVVATWTLDDVQLTSFGTTGADPASGALPTVQRVALRFNNVRFDYDPPPPDPRGAARGTWDLFRNVTTGAGLFGDEDYAGDKSLQLGTARLQVLDHQWSQFKPASGTAQAQDFLFTLPMNAAAPAVMASVAAGTRLPQVRYQFRHGVAGTDQFQQVRYTLEDVILRSFSVAQPPGGGEPRVGLGLDVGAMDMETRTFDRDGNLVGSPVLARWDLEGPRGAPPEQTLTADGVTAASPAGDPAGALALTSPGLAPHRLQLGAMQFEVLSYDWGAERPFEPPGGGGGVGPSTKRDMGVVLGWSPELARLFHATALGQHFAEAVIRSTTDPDVAAATYATWTLGDVTVSSAATTWAGTGDPVYAFALRFDSAELRYDPPGPAAAVTAGFDWSTARGSGTTTLGSESQTGNRTLTVGGSTLAIRSYGWDAARPGGAATPGSFFFETGMSTASPGLMRAVGDGRRFPSAAFRTVEPEAGGLREIVWTFDDVFVTSYAAGLAAPGGTPVDSFSLGFRTIRLSTRRIDPAGHTIGRPIDSRVDFATGRVLNRAADFGNAAGESRHGVDFGSGMADVLGFGISSQGRQFEPVHVTAPASSASPMLLQLVLEDAFPWPLQLVVDGALPVTVHSVADVAARHAFYNRSGYDGGASAAGPDDDAAVATDKRPLLPGDAAGFDNLTSFPGGVTGVMIDVAGLPTGDPLTADDFVFRVGTAGDPSSWRAAPPPLEVARRDNAGASGSTRLSVTWPHGAVRNTWLQVTLKANARTGLRQDDVFYFGNLPGETGDPRTPDRVSVFDYARILRARPARPADVTDPLDIDRDGVVGARDVLAVRRALFSSLPLITPQPATPLAAEPPARPTDLLEESH